MIPTYPGKPWKLLSLVLVRHMEDMLQLFKHGMALCTKMLRRRWQDWSTKKTLCNLTWSKTKRVSGEGMIEKPGRLTAHHKQSVLTDYASERFFGRKALSAEIHSFSWLIFPGRCLPQPDVCIQGDILLAANTYLERSGKMQRKVVAHCPWLKQLPYQ